MSPNGFPEGTHSMIYNLSADATRRVGLNRLKFVLVRQTQIALLTLCETPSLTPGDGQNAATRIHCANRGTSQGMVARVQASQGGASSPINALRVPRAMPAVLHGRGEVASVPHPPVRAGLRKGRSLSRAAGRDQAVAARRKRSSCEVRNFGASSETPLPAPPQERGEAFFKSVATAEKAKEAESKPTTKDGPATASAKPAHHRMYSVMIRVYENRLVQVALLSPLFACLWPWKGEWPPFPRFRGPALRAPNSCR